MSVLSSGIESLGGYGDKRKSQENYQDVRNLGVGQFNDTVKVNDALTKSEGDAYQKNLAANTDYRKQYADAIGPRIMQQSKMAYQSDKDRKASQGVYKDQLSPAMQKLTDRAQGNAMGAMSLQNAMSGNNSTAQSYQGMYNDQGQQFKDMTKAETAGLSAGGNTGNALSDSVQQSSAGQALARARGRMDNLEQQGMVQGHIQGLNQYGRGQQARDLSQNMTKQGFDMMQKNMGNQMTGREEASGLKKGQMESQTGYATAMADSRRAGLDNFMNYNTNQAGRNVAAINQRTGVDMAALGGAQNVYASNQGILGMGMPVLGAMAGNAAGNNQAQNGQAQPQQQQQQQNTASNPYANQNTGYGSKGYGLNQNQSYQQPANQSNVSQNQSYQQSGSRY